MKSRFSQNHVFEVAVVPNFQTNPIDLKCRMHVSIKCRYCMNYRDYMGRAQLVYIPNCQQLRLPTTFYQKLRLPTLHT